MYIHRRKPQSVPLGLLVADSGLAKPVAHGHSNAGLKPVLLQILILRAHESLLLMQAPVAMHEVPSPAAATLSVSPANPS